MCRNIKTLFNFDPPVTDEEIRAASLQFVRKISGFNKPSKANESAFATAVDEVASVSTRLSVRSTPARLRGIGRKRPQRPRLAPPNDSALKFAEPLLREAKPLVQSFFRIITCFSQAKIDKVSGVSGKPQSKPRSGCPVSVSLETFGDRWSLLIIRDLMVRGFRTFKEFHESGEGIATNILAGRLRRLEAAGIITAEKEDADRRRLNYRLTEKGIDLAPVLLELLVWGARHEETGAPCALIAKMAKNREQVLAEVRRRWRERDSTPLLPRFGDNGIGRGSAPGRRNS